MQVYKEIASGGGAAAWSYGTFPAVLEGVSVGPVYGSPGNATGFYYKTGQMIAFKIRFSNLGACSAAGSAVLITGLPFIGIGASFLFEHLEAKVFGYVSPFDVVSYHPHISGFGLNILVRTTHQNSFSSNLTNQNMNGAGYVEVSGFYITVE